MRKKKLILDYTGVNDDEFNTLIGKVIDCLTGHAVLTTPPVTLEDLKTQADDFVTKWQRASRGGSILEIAEKNAAKEMLALSLKDIAFYVNKIADGSRAILLSSGLILEADPKSADTPEVVTEVSLVDGRQRNQLLVKFKAQKSAIMYEYQVANAMDADGEPLWGDSFDTSKSYGNVFSPVFPGQIYYLRVRGRNKKGVGDWSAVASLRTR